MRILRNVSLFLVAVSFLFVPSAAGASYKCKDIGHVRTVPFTGGAILSLGHTAVRVDSNPQCRNDPTYHGPLYVIVIDGKDGLHILPPLAAQLKTALIAATASVSIQHTVNGGRWSTWRSFTAPAANALGNQFAAAGA